MPIRVLALMELLFAKNLALKPIIAAVADPGQTERADILWQPPMAPRYAPTTSV